jgi:hypothetical protein
MASLLATGTSPGREYRFPEEFARAMTARSVSAGGLPGV